MTSLTQQMTSAVAQLRAVSVDVTDFQTADDATLVSLSKLAAREKQLAEAHLALIAGEIAARSTREMGHSGLAQRSGFRSAEELVKVTTGASGREAVTAVRVGTLVREAAVDGSTDPDTGLVFEAAEPWLAPVAAAVAAGALSVGAADAIRAGLGQPSDNVSADALASAAAELCALATTLDVDRLRARARARELRDDLDAAGVADRERERFDKRSLRHFELSNGMGRFVWDLDPENYAIAKELYNRATSPKRGVRFVDGPNKDTAERILNDPRTIGQLASDTFLGLLQAGSDADSSHLLGTGGASVRVLVSKATLDGDGSGIGRIEGITTPISAATVQRLSCDGTTTEITLDSFGRPLDVGREQRTFTPKQRIALAVRDGACMFGDCDKEPAMTEAHHIIPWAEGGRTDLANGILLCRFHHLLIHNNGWEIYLVRTDYYLLPPPDIDPTRTPRPMPSKSAAMHDLKRELAAAGA